MPTLTNEGSGWEAFIFFEDMEGAIEVEEIVTGFNALVLQIRVKKSGEVQGNGWAIGFKITSSDPDLKDLEETLLGLADAIEYNDKNGSRTD